MPKNAFHFPSAESEERWGKAIYGDDWIGQQAAEEQRLLAFFRDPRKDWGTFTPDESADVSRLDDWEYRGPSEYGQQAEAVRNRALTRQRQLAQVRKELDLLHRYGLGEPPRTDTLCFVDFDPLENLPDDPSELEILVQARARYWNLKLQKQSAKPTAGEEGTKPDQKKIWRAKAGARLTKGETAVLEALRSIYPHRFLEHKAKARDERINEWLNAHGVKRISSRVIQRALKKMNLD
jgi:hypothetical protein